VEVIYVLLPAALLLAGLAVAVFLWAARSGQFDDLTTPQVRILHDDLASRRGRVETPAAEPQDGNRTPPVQ